MGKPCEFLTFSTASLWTLTRACTVDSIYTGAGGRDANTEVCDITGAICANLLMSGCLALA